MSIAIKRLEILIALIEGKLAKKDDNLSWQWSPPWKGAPSLNNNAISYLFQAGFVAEAEDILSITETGKIILNTIALSQDLSGG